MRSEETLAQVALGLRWGSVPGGTDATNWCKMNLII